VKRAGGKVGLWPLALCAPALIVALSVWALSTSRGSALPTESYATYAEAEAQAAFAPVPRGWLPSFIPAGATALRVAHDGGTHQSWGEFRLPQAGWTPGLAAKAQPTELMLLGAPDRVAWWPTALRGRVASADLRAQGYRVFVLEQERSPLVVAVLGAQVYWWRLARQ